MNETTRLTIEAARDWDRKTLTRLLTTLANTEADLERQREEIAVLEARVRDLDEALGVHSSIVVSPEAFEQMSSVRSS